MARVPIYGDLRFLDRDGQPSQKGARQGAESSGGINVGKESDYREFRRRWFARRRHLDVRQHRRKRAFPRRAAGEARAAAGNDDSRVPHVQGEHRTADHRQPGVAQSGNEAGKRPASFFSIKDATHRPARFIKRKLDKKGARRGRPKDRSVQRPGAQRPAGSRVAMPRPGAISGHGVRPICTFAPAMPRLSATFVKAISGIWFQMVLVIAIGRHVQHVPQRLGRDAGDAGLHGDGLFHRLRGAICSRA